MATITKRFGEKMRKLRKQKEMSQLDLAQKAKIDLTTVSELETGGRNPMLKTIRKVAIALGVPIKDLLN